MTLKKETGRDLGEGATRTMLLQSIRNDYPGLTGGAQCARMLAAMRRAETCADEVTP